MTALDVGVLETAGVLELGTREGVAHAVMTFGPWLIYTRAFASTGKFAVSVLGSGQAIGVFDDMPAVQVGLNRALSTYAPNDTYRWQANKALARMVEAFKGDTE